MPLSFEIQGRDLLKCPTAAVVVINHQSSIDLMSLFEIWPLLEHAGPIAKRELLYIQPFGLACWLCGAEFINRRSKTSHQDINDMGSRAKSEGKKLIIFPEGTRNGAKGLSMLPFKKGETEEFCKRSRDQRSIFRSISYRYRRPVAHPSCRPF